MRTTGSRRRARPSSSLVLRLFLLACQTSSLAIVDAWSHRDVDRRPLRLFKSNDVSSFSRRQWISSSVASLTTTAGVTMMPFPSNAACLPGDLRKECIGVYKVPIDDRVLPYVSTPEALQKFAPDLQYVPPIVAPDSVPQAWDILETQRLAAVDIQNVVQAGRLEEAGIKVLNLVPKVTSSGKVVLEDSLKRISKNASSSSSSVVDEMVMDRLQSQWDMVLGLWGESDVMIGQGLRGDMGVSAVAQIQILNQLKDATAALDDFMASAALASGKGKSN